MGYLKSFLENVGEAMGPMGQDLRVPMSFVHEVSKALGQEGIVTPMTNSVASRMTERLMDLTREQLVAEDPVFAGMCQDFEREAIDDDKIAIPGLLPAKPDALKRYTIRRDKKNPLKWIAAKDRYKGWGSSAPRRKTSPRRKPINTLLARSK